MIDQNSGKIELLAPAGSYEIFKAVIHAGADAVYVGGSSFGARAYANNFSEEELLNAIDYAHIHGRKLYLTVNTLLKEEELEKRLYEYLLPYYKQGLDAVIVQDLGAFSFIRQVFPDLAIHTSTQMTVTNRYGAQMMKELGASRIVTAREMSFEEIEDIARHVDIEIESFVHGALCYCYSGQCLLSSMLGGRSGNRGRCAQPCRLPYEVYEADKKQRIKTEPFVLSPKDLCTIKDIPKLVACGIHSFKIEGRMKQAVYAAGVVSIYRKYIDKYLTDGADHFSVSDEDMKKLYDFGNRSGFTDGYYERHNGKEMITFKKPNHAKGNDTLQEMVKEAYIDSEIKEKINGKLILNKDFPARIEVSKDDISVTVEGDVVMSALNQPLSPDKIRENIQKTGNTPFIFEHLTIEAEDSIFLPMKALNQLRRDALTALSEALLERFRRSEEQCRASLGTLQISSPEEEMGKKEILSAGDREGKSDMHLAVSLEQRRQLPAVLAFRQAEDIYLDNSCYDRKSLLEFLKEDVEAIHKAGKKVFFIFPTVFRRDTSEFYLKIKRELLALGLDGVVVKSYDALFFACSELKGMRLILDQSLYSFNNRAVQALIEYEPIRITAPFELNRKEFRTRKNQNSEILLYGYLPLMTSAQCVHANTGRCDKKPGIVCLKDRYGKYFPVKNNCTECYNTIYNTTPLMLFSYKEALRQDGFSHFRISFTVETEQEITAILDIYERVFEKENCKLTDLYTGEYTNGHFKRGVE